MQGRLGWFAQINFLAVVASLAGTSLAQNTNGAPGNWLPAIGHGSHTILGGGTTACKTNSVDFIPVHASLIPIGTYQGCVLVWEKGGQSECLVDWPSAVGSEVDVRWAIFDPRVSPPVIHKFAWRITLADSPPPPCNDWVGPWPGPLPAPGPNEPRGYQGFFCSGHCWLPDGRLLVAGGDYWSQHVRCGINAEFAGSRFVAVFNPNEVDINQPFQMTNGPGFGKPWTSLHNPPAAWPQVDLEVPRWYPSLTLMAPANLSPQNPDVYVSVAGGVEKYEPHPNCVPSLGDPAYNTHELLRWNLTTGVVMRDPRPGTTQAPGVAGLFRGPTTPGSVDVCNNPSLGGLSFFYFPRTHFVSARTGHPDGRLWMAGMITQSADADVINFPETWVNGDVLNLGASATMLEESTVVLFPPITPGYRDVQMVIGGLKTTNTHGGSNVTDEVFFMPTRTQPASWVPGGLTLRMIHARKFADAVLLPDASIAVIGGGVGVGHGAPGGGVLVPELFANGGWIKLSDQLSERTYHSWAMLLPDGRVLSGGGDTRAFGADYEILEPPYLTGGPARPSFFAAPPAAVQYAQQYSCVANLPFGQGVQRVVLVSPASVTHSQDPNQRFEPLAFELADDGTLDFVTPNNPTIAPPGYYMMFLVSTAGVPSLAHWIRLMP